jgi:small conductance mechanosensitive channel
MAFQGTLGNFAAGIMLLVFRPFKVGDFVEVNDDTGVCEHIDLFTCEFRTLDNRKLIIPNGAVFGSTITNYTGYDVRRVDVDVGADYSASIDATRKALETSAAGVPGMIKDPAPQVFLKGLGGSSVDWQVRVWCKTDDYWDVWQATVRACKVSLDEAGIGIPFPQQDVHLDEAVIKALSN